MTGRQLDRQTYVEALQTYHTVCAGNIKTTSIQEWTQVNLYISMCNINLYTKVSVWKNIYIPG